MNPNQTTSSSSTVSAEAISRRAYEIWEQEGCPENCDLRHWLQAEQELSGTPTSVRSNGGQSASETSYSPPRETQATVRTTTDTRALQGTRTAPPRDRRTTTTPFERAAAGSSVAATTKRR